MYNEKYICKFYCKMVVKNTTIRKSSVASVLALPLAALRIFAGVLPFCRLKVGASGDAFAFPTTAEGEFRLVSAF